MSTIAGFDEPWYSEIINRFSPDTGDRKTDALCHTLLACACILAEDISGVAKAIRDLADSVDLVSNSLDAPR